VSLAHTADQTPPRAGPRGWARQLAGWLRRDILALAVFVATALLAIYPVLPNPRALETGSYGDNVQYTYMAGWMAQSVLLGKSPFVDPRPNYPDSLVLTATDAPYIHMLAVAPVTLTLGPVFAYNLVIFLSHVLTGYCAYLWVLRLTGSRAGGLVAGLGFLLMPNRILHSSGNLPEICTHALVIFFWALDSTLTAARIAWRRLLVLGAATWFLAGTSQYLLMMGLICGGVYALLTILWRRGMSPHDMWHVAETVLIGTAIGALPYFVGARNDVYQPYIFSDIRMWAAAPMNFILPSVLHPIWGELFARLRPEPLAGEKTLYIGAITGGLALAALLWRRSPYRGRNLVWLGAGLTAAVLSLGNDLHLDTNPVNEANPVFLPAYYLAKLPFLSFMRVWPRFGVVTTMFVALLAGVAVAQICARAPRRGWLIAAGISALVLIDLLPGISRAITVAPRPVDLWLAEQPGDFGVAFLPPVVGGAPDGNDYRILYGSLFPAKHVTAFFHPYHKTAAYRDFIARAAGFPGPAAIARLRQMGFRYLVLEHDTYGQYGTPPLADVLAAVRASPDLEIVAEPGDTTVIALR
jgi:hypothetical protein